MRGVIERIDQEAAGAEAGEALKAARMLVYDEEQLEWVACRLSLRVTALACAIAGRGEGRGRTELALEERRTKKFSATKKRPRHARLTRPRRTDQNFNHSSWLPKVGPKPNF